MSKQYLNILQKNNQGLNFYVEIQSLMILLL